MRWDSCVQRTRLVFAAAGVTAANLQWENNNYIGRYQQEALLELEGRLRQFHEWPAAPGQHGLGGSDAFMGALVTLRTKAQRVVQAHATGEMLSDEDDVYPPFLTRSAARARARPGLGRGLGNL